MLGTSYKPEKPTEKPFINTTTNTTQLLIYRGNFLTGTFGPEGWSPSAPPKELTYEELEACWWSSDTDMTLAEFISAKGTVLTSRVCDSRGRLIPHRWYRDKDTGRVLPFRMLVFKLYLSVLHVVEKLNKGLNHVV